MAFPPEAKTPLNPKLKPLLDLTAAKVIKREDKVSLGKVADKRATLDLRVSSSPN